MGYTFTVDHLEYVAHSDGSALTLVDCVRATQGCGNTSVLRDGQPILRRGINCTEVYKRGEWKVSR